ASSHPGRIGPSSDDPGQGSARAARQRVLEFDLARFAQLRSGLLRRDGYVARCLYGGWRQQRSGHYDALSLAHLRVQIPTCVEYQFYGSVTPMDGAGYVEVRSGLQKYIYVDNGELSQSGRLPSGTYDFES